MAHSTSSVVLSSNLHPAIVGVVDLIAGSAGKLLFHFNFETNLVYLLGGCATVLVGQPLDTIKVKMQSFPHLYNNTWTCFKQTFVKVNLIESSKLILFQIDFV